MHDPCGLESSCRNLRQKSWSSRTAGKAERLTNGRQTHTTDKARIRRQPRPTGRPANRTTERQTVRSQLHGTGHPSAHILSCVHFLSSGFLKEKRSEVWLATSIPTFSLHVSFLPGTYLLIINSIIIYLVNRLGTCKEIVNWVIVFS